jgi:hypothetical protein
LVWCFPFVGEQAIPSSLRSHTILPLLAATCLVPRWSHGMCLDLREAIPTLLTHEAMCSSVFQISRQIVLLVHLLRGVNPPARCLAKQEYSIWCTKLFLDLPTGDSKSFPFPKQGFCKVACVRPGARKSLLHIVWSRILQEFTCYRICIRPQVICHLPSCINL